MDKQFVGAVEPESPRYGEKRYQFLSGSTLKLIAIIIMLIDHVGASLLGRLFSHYYIPFSDWNKWVEIYNIMRMIGRVAFPIFCFLLVEGFLHTRNVKKYAIRLGIFALISEFPFDLAFFEQWNTGYQNVFFTLFIGLLCIWAMDELGKSAYFTKEVTMFKHILLAAVQVIYAMAAMGAAYFLKTDYGLYGVLTIIVLYLFRSTRIFSLLAGYFVLFSIDPFCFPGFILTLFYNGKKGFSMKYAFYIFYPAHLIILWIIGNLILK